MLRKLLPHITIVMCLMYVVFFCIDRVNSAMAFIDNEITKWLLLALCLISIVEALWLIADERRKARRRQERLAAKKRAARAGSR